MMIHLALDGLPDWTASDELKQFAYVHIAPSLDQMARTYQQAGRASAGRAGSCGGAADGG
jgi:phytoene dehydrogenase-like protein